MKIDYKKDDKEIYFPKAAPSLTRQLPMIYFAIDGKGEPGSEYFKNAVEALYTASYTLKMSPKKGSAPQGYCEYTVYPLEGLWRAEDISDRESYEYTLMIRQPGFLTPSAALRVLAEARAKKKNPLLAEVCFKSVPGGLWLSAMHTGPYAEEQNTLARMDEFCVNNGYRRLSDEHKEIYIGNPEKTAGEKLKTVLSYRVEKL